MPEKARFNKCLRKGAANIEKDVTPHGPEVPPEVPERVSPKSGVCLEVSEDTLSDTPRGTFGPFGPEDSCRGPASSQS